MEFTDADVTLTPGEAFTAQKTFREAAQNELRQEYFDGGGTSPGWNPDDEATRKRAYFKYCRAKKLYGSK